MYQKEEEKRSEVLLVIREGGKEGEEHGRTRQERGGRVPGLVTTSSPVLVDQVHQVNHRS